MKTSSNILIITFIAASAAVTCSIGFTTYLCLKYSEIDYVYNLGSTFSIMSLMISGLMNSVFVYQKNQEINKVIEKIRNNPSFINALWVLGFVLVILSVPLCFMKAKVNQFETNQFFSLAISVFIFAIYVYTYITLRKKGLPTV